VAVSLMKIYVQWLSRYKHTCTLKFDLLLTKAKEIVYTFVGMFSFDYLNSLMRRPSILDLVHTTMTQSRNKRVQYFIKPRIPSEPPVPVNILYPISRNDVVHSLLHLCRSTIRGNIRLDHIERLTIPSSLKDYVRDGQYYCEDTVTASPPYDVNRPPPPPPPLSSWRPRGPQH